MSAASLHSSASDDLSTRLAALSAKATPGPWAVGPEHVVVAHDPQSPDRPWYVAEMVAAAGSGTISDNAAFIAAAVNAVRSGALVPAPTEAARGLAVTEVDPSEQTQRYHKRPFTAFATRDEKRRKQIVTLPMDVILAVVRERLEYLGENYDPDAVTQNVACEIERAMGVFPNLEAALRTSPPETVGGGDGHRCPRCDSPDPKRHPAMQFEGEVQICPHPFHAALSSAPPTEETWQAPSEDDLKRAYGCLVRGRPVYGGDGGTYAVEVPRQEDFIALVHSLLPPAPAGEAK